MRRHTSWPRDWSSDVCSSDLGVPPQVDFAAEKRLADVLIAAGADVLLDSAHDVSGGGLAHTLVECVLRHGTGVRVVLDDLLARDGIDLPTLLFSEPRSEEHTSELQSR